MTPLHFEDVEVGFRFETPRRTITEADLVAFAASPATSTRCTRTRSSPRRRSTVSASRTARSSSRWRRVSASEPGSSTETLMGLLEIRSWRFIAPVRIGDTIRVRNEVRELRRSSKPDRGIMVQSVEVVNQTDEVVNDRELVLLLKRR